MLATNELFKEKHAWKITGDFNIPVSGGSIEVTTYSDGDIVFWEPDLNVSIALPMESVDKLSKILTNIKKDKFITNKSIVKVEPITKLESEYKGEKVIIHILEDDLIPSTRIEDTVLTTKVIESIPEVKPEVKPEVIPESIPKIKPVIIKKSSIKKEIKSSNIIERKVSKEDKGWGCNVDVDGKTIRYYYKTRDSARAAKNSDILNGVEGRVK